MIFFRSSLNRGIFVWSTCRSDKPSYRQKSVILLSLSCGSGSGSGSCFFLPLVPLPFLPGAFFSSTGGFSDSLISLYFCFLAFYIVLVNPSRLISFYSSFFSSPSGSSSAVYKLKHSFLFYLNSASRSANFFNVRFELLRNMIIWISFYRGT